MTHKQILDLLKIDINPITLKKEKSIYREIIVGLISGISVSGILFFASSIGLLLSLVFGGLILCSTFAYIIGRNTSANDHGKAGIISIECDSHQKIGTEAFMQNIENDFIMWGISAKRTISNPAMKQWLESLPKSHQKAKFLLLDPESPHLARKAEDEGDNPDAWKREISANISRIGELCSKYPSLIELRVYSEFPIWRVVFIDEKIAIMNYFPSGKQGPESPQFILKKGEDSLFDPIYKEFLEVWNYRSKRVTP